MRDTGPSRKTREAVEERDSWGCLRCGTSVDPWPGLQIHHRRPRGMGGSRDPETNGPANLVVLCDSCHREVESNREQASDDGYLVAQGRTPALVALLRHDRVWVFLNDDGTSTVRASRQSATFRRAPLPPAADSSGGDGCAGVDLAAVVDAAVEAARERREGAG